MTQRPPITLLVPTLNEEWNLPACLASVDEIVHATFVVDSGSTDRTLDIAERFGATVVHHPFETHATQWHWALHTLPIETDWVLALDADQHLTPALRDEMVHLFTERQGRLDSIVGFYLNRRQIFQGRWIRHGGYYPKYLLKLFRRDRVQLDVRELVDHHFYVDGPTDVLHGDLVEENRKEDDLAFWKAKHRRYARLMALEEQQRRVPSMVPPGVGSDPHQRAAWRRGVWSKLPLFVRPVLYFLYRMIIRAGFRDGRQGIVFHFYHALWFRWLVDAELRRLDAPAESR